MDWKEASSHYVSRLRKALNVHRHALHLVKLPQAGINPEDQELLESEGPIARTQLKRLEEGEFRIAVVGLEKAGKSTFINAWLECDLLPSKQQRCTFTTTQVFSEQDDSRQRLEVIPKTDSEFEQLVKELNEAANNQSEEQATNARRDLNTIKSYEDSLSQVRSDGVRSIQFSRLEDIKDPLQKYVADEAFAHAVAEARLFTSNLASTDGVVFYDLPGLDSGLAKHVEESKDMLADCDAVIVVQRDPTIRGAELQLLKFTRSGDPYVNVADKLFVFMSRIDQLGSLAALEDNLESIRKEWKKHANLPPERVVPGSAIAHLVLNGLASSETINIVGDAESIEPKLQSVTQISNPELLKTKGVGIPVFRDQINEYINSERVVVLQKRCEAILDSIVSQSEAIYVSVRSRFPEDPETAKQIQQDRRRIEFQQWWDHHWLKIKGELKKYVESNILHPEVVDEASPVLLQSIDMFKERYLELIDGQMNTLRNVAEERRKLIFEAVQFGSFDRMRVNFEWREVLYSEVYETISHVAKDLTSELTKEALEFVERMTSLLWGSEEVEKRMIGDTLSFIKVLEHSLSVLFLRFTRPIIQAIIRAPLNSEIRERIIERLGADIEIVDKYYSGKEEALKLLKRYATYGRRLIYDRELRREVIRDNLPSPKRDPRSGDESPEHAVIIEIETDLDVLASYLREAVFEAAGFRAFFMQELERLNDLFVQLESVWRGVAENEWMRGNPRMLQELPADLQNQDFDVEVSDRLRQLQIALQDYKFINQPMSH